MGNLGNMRGPEATVSMSSERQAHRSDRLRKRTPIDETHGRDTKTTGTGRVGIARHLSAPAERTAAPAGARYFCGLQRFAVFRVCVGRLAADREQSDHPELE